MSDTNTSGHDSDKWDDASFVVRSQRRVIVLEHLLDGPMTPSEIAHAAPDNIQVSHASRGLRALSDRNLVELLVSEDTKKGRYYGLSDYGRTIYHHIEDHNLN